MTTAQLKHGTFIITENERKSRNRFTTERACGRTQRVRTGSIQTHNLTSVATPPRRAAGANATVKSVSAT